MLANGIFLDMDESIHHTAKKRYKSFRLRWHQLALLPSSDLSNTAENTLVFALISSHPCRQKAPGYKCDTNITQCVPDILKKYYFLCAFHSSNPLKLKLFPGYIVLGPRTWVKGYYLKQNIKKSLFFNCIELFLLDWSLCELPLIYLFF